MKKKELKLTIKSMDKRINGLFNDIDKILNDDWMVKEKYKVLLSMRKEAERVILRPFSERLKFALVYKEGDVIKTVRAGNVFELEIKMGRLKLEPYSCIGIISNEIGSCDFIAETLDLKPNFTTYIKNVNALESDGLNHSFDAFIYCFPSFSTFPPIYLQPLISHLK